MTDGWGWHTIESDAGVFTHLVEQLGVSGVEFEELHAIDATSLASIGDIYGLIFLFKYMEPNEQLSVPSGQMDAAAAERLFFAEEIDLGERMKEFKTFTESFPSDIRGEALSNSDLIRSVHNSFSQSTPFVSDESQIGDKDQDVFHYIAYTSIHGVLYELDGLQPHPISHGPSSEQEFAERVIPVLQKRIETFPASEIHFNLLAACKDRRQYLREVGDEQGLRREEVKRQRWEKDNAMRSHNFVAFIYQLLHTTVREKGKDGSYDSWLNGTKSGSGRGSL